MNEEVDHIKTLMTARSTLVKERRALSVAIALGYRRRRTDENHTGEMRDAFMGAQNMIEAIERAIAHEQLITDQPELYRELSSESATLNAA